jgi:hypothetical protein
MRELKMKKGKWKTKNLQPEEEGTADYADGRRRRAANRKPFFMDESAYIGVICGFKPGGVQKCRFFNSRHSESKVEHDDPCPRAF